MTRIFISLLFLSFATFTAAEELFTPRTDFVVNSYTELNTAKAEIWDKYSDRKRVAYEVRQQKELAAYEEYEEQRLQALDRLSKADWENYAQWLDAKERHDYDRRIELETTVPALQEYVEKHARIAAVREQARKHAELQYEAVEMAADHVREVEELNAERAFQLQNE